jgi:tetratricopeptide (TPR) repeat protein
MRANKSLRLISVFLLMHACLWAQPDINSLRETVRTFQRQGDYDNAVLVINKALQTYPNNEDLLMDLAYTQYLQQDIPAAKQTIEPLLDKPDATVQTFQVAGNIYKALGDSKECVRLYKKGLSKYPKSGALHAEYGELLLYTQKDKTAAIAEWEAGIKMDPSYAGNYYHAAKFYHANQSWVWALFYGEVFINLESLSTRTAEVKSLLADAYKKFFLEQGTAAKRTNAFEAAFAATLAKQSDLTGNGINAESLTMIRSRFLLDWYNGPAQRFPHKLFDVLQGLSREGLFDSYNQWVFGATGNIVAFQNWVGTHQEEYASFTKFHRNRIFKVPEGQYYH